MPVLDAGWHTWLDENTRRGCSIDSMIAAMVNAGFDHNAASANVMMYRNGGHVATVPGFVQAPAAGQSANSQQYAYDACLVDEGNFIVAHDRTVRVSARWAQPEIIVLDGVLSHEECDEIVETSRGRLERSLTINAETGQNEVIAERASEGMSYQRAETPLCQRVEQRLAALAHWPVDNGEGLQILHYGLGGQYKPHYDYFPLEEPGSAVQLQYGGQRVATIIMYLNDVEEGGETIFPKVGVSVIPRKGSAVYFRYLNRAGQVDPLSWHGGAPVRKGEKWIMTKWLRERIY